MRTVLAALVLLISPLVAAAEEPALRVMTFNIRYDNKGDGENAWPHRKDFAAEIIREQKTDIVGLQEALRHQVKDLEERLPGYAWYGVGRDDGDQRGETVTIFYKKDRFKVLDKGNFWLSDTPDKPGSKGWDAAITRLVTWLKLEDQQSGRTFLMANTHFDHIGRQARAESARLVLRQLPKLAGDLPVVLTGDFNTPPRSEPYNILVGADAASTWTFTDARKASKTDPQGPDSTWNGFRAVRPGQQIDFIFTVGLETNSYAVLDMKKDGRFPSDHLPVIAELQFPEKK